MRGGARSVGTVVPASPSITTLDLQVVQVLNNPTGAGIPANQLLPVRPCSPESLPSLHGERALVPVFQETRSVGVDVAWEPELCECLVEILVVRGQVQMRG